MAHIHIPCQSAWCEFRPWLRLQRRLGGGGGGLGVQGAAMASSPTRACVITTCILTTFLFSTVGKVQQSSQEKGCSSNTCTPLAFSVTLGNARTFGYDLQCCSSELCNQKDMFVSQKSPDPNGVKCPACYSEESVFCGTTDLTCAGRETKCVEVVGTALDGLAMYGMGCATENACNLKGQQLLSGIKIWTRCIDPSSGGPALLSATSSMLSSLFLLKVFL
ncbi:protein RoBo-1-like [Lepus europaeus]|uniref:protein RoBo-1-like n=1 Tax=Lepus europaeus TaxID=9983 RepID=UPI002B4A61F5|nr:protein RoBo-1-like [Lepus europaeus]